MLQLEDLKAKNDMLLHTLKSVAASPHLDPDEAASIRDAIVNVGSPIPVKA